MQRDFDCPICSSRDWQDVQRYHYHCRDHVEPSAGGRLLRRLGDLWPLLVHNAPVSPPGSQRSLNPYERLRRRVLFEVWQPEREEITLTVRLCTHCGFAAYSPRPTAADLRAKYQFLADQAPAAPVASAASTAEAPPLEALLNHRRAQRVFALVRGVNNQAGLAVLDYGGASGVMLRPFLAAGHHCSLVDYNDSQLPGVEKIADDLDDLESSSRFDVILCNHVLEHVAEPLRLVATLRQHLRPAGVIYAEVPHQILGGVRLGADPVTHVNFFSLPALRRLFARGGYEVIRDATQTATYGRARLKVSWLLARQSEALGAGAPTPAGARISPAEISLLLHPGRLPVVSHLLRHYVLPRAEDLMLQWRLRLFAPGKWGRS